MTHDDMIAALERDGQHRVLRRVPSPQTTPPPDGALVGLALDVETTGTDHDADDVIEIAAARFAYDVGTGAVLGIIERLDMLRDPGRPIPPEVTAITGITDADVAGLSIDLDRLAVSAAGASIVIAHNAAFDRPFAEKLHPVFATVPWACTLAQVDWRSEGVESGKLGWLLTEFGLFYDAHRAAADVDALVALLGQTLPRTGGNVLGRVLANAGAPTWDVWAVGAPYARKDELKRRGYRWNDGGDGRHKAWHLDDAPIARAHEENQILSAYCQPKFRRVDALLRFSRR